MVTIIHQAHLAQLKRPEVKKVKIKYYRHFTLEQETYSSTFKTV